MYDDVDLRSFAVLREAFIDASSLIYMHKTGFLQQLRERVRLYSVPEVLDEAGLPTEGFQLEVCPEKHVSHDEKLLQCALKRGLPLISEDRKLLMQAKRSGLPYYNSLMMLNFLLLKQAVDSEEYDACLHRLRRYARYSDSVWSYGEHVRQRIHEEFSVCTNSRALEREFS